VSRDTNAGVRMFVLAGVIIVLCAVGTIIINLNEEVAVGPSVLVVLVGA